MKIVYLVVIAQQLVDLYTKVNGACNEGCWSPIGGVSIIDNYPTDGKKTYAQVLVRSLADAGSSANGSDRSTKDAVAAINKADLERSNSRSGVGGDDGSGGKDGAKATGVISTGTIEAIAKKSSVKVGG